MELQTHGISSQDRIQKHAVLRASRSRVWRAITDPNELGAWFGLRLDGAFTPGATVRGVIAPTTVDAEVAKEQRKHEGMKFEMMVERVEPERLFAFRWPAYPVENERERQNVPHTLVTFELEETAEGVLLSVTESGFDKVSPDRRAQARASNEGGWTKQMELIQKYLAPS
jgi:uncharacterized protein YndB with AHSA1/START domain